MLSLIGAMIERDGEAAVERWAKGMVANFARMLRSSKPEDKQMVGRVGLVWPNQQASGAHVNIAVAARRAMRRIRKQP